ncbi:hypothetical protein FNF29_07368 [Cafeteria roenbergensis]|uniref:EF-hand domain-containing protein n=2 Tax=Cafeteria roenbergensis TaxID=33653 RepID=A0A5A8C354_CAFRO|nr:hypothetical protein FNF29_07368 [Cafeteria roenbergensis]|eukprot:KAA0147423.1 hypothetical protein FNF29_07368 [Cafeteria roenbergensis]
MGAGDSRPAAVPLDGLAKGDILLLGGTQETDIGALPRGLVQGVVAAQRTNSFATQKQRLSSWTAVAIVLQHKQDKYLLRPDADGLQVQPLQAGLALLARAGTAIAVRRPVLPPPEAARFGATLDELLVTAARGLRWDAFLPGQGPGSAAPASARARGHGVASGPSSATLGLFGGSKAAMHASQSGAPSSGSGAASSSSMARKRLASSRMLGTFSKGSPAKGGAPSLRAPPGSSSRHLGGASASKHRWNMAQMALVEVRRAFHRADRDRSGAIDASEVRSFLADVRGRAVTEAESRAFRELVDADGDGLLSERELVIGLQRVPLRDSAVPDGVDLDAIVSAETVASVLEIAGLLVARRCVDAPGMRRAGDSGSGRRKRGGGARGPLEQDSDESDDGDDEVLDDRRALAAAGLVVPRRASAKVAPAGGGGMDAGSAPQAASGGGGGWGRRAARVAPHPDEAFEPDAKLAPGAAAGRRDEPSTTRSGRSARIGKLPMVHLGSVVVVDADSSVSLHFRPASFSTAAAGRRERVRLRAGRLEPEAPVLVDARGTSEEEAGPGKRGKQTVLGSALAAAAGALGCAASHGFDGWYGEATTEDDELAGPRPAPDKAAAEASLSKLAAGDPAAEDAFVRRTMEDLRSRDGAGMVAGRPARRKKRPSKRR